MLTPRDREVLGRSVLFRNLGPEDVDDLVDAGSVLKLERNLQLFAQGDPASRLFVVVDGQIKLSRLAANGDEAVVEIIGAGQSFAEAAMFLEAHYPVSASAITDARVVAVAHTRLKALLTREPAMVFAMMASMSHHLHVLVAQIEEMKLLTTRQRLIRYLLAQCGRGPGPVSFQLATDKALIANRLGMQPETFSRVLARLASDGVSVSGSIVTVAEPDRLAGLLEDR